MCSDCQMWRASAISGRTTSRTTPPIARRRSSAFAFARQRRLSSCEICGDDRARTVAGRSHPGSWTSTIDSRQKNPSTSPALERCSCPGPVSWQKYRNANRLRQLSRGPNLQMAARAGQTCLRYVAPARGETTVLERTCQATRTAPRCSLRRLRSAISLSCDAVRPPRFIN